MELERLEITTCLKRGEVEVVTRYEPDAQTIYDALVAAVRERHVEQLFSEDGSTIDEQVAATARWRAEACPRARSPRPSRARAACSRRA